MFLRGYDPRAHVLFGKIRNPYMKAPVPESVGQAQRKLGIRSTPGSAREKEPEAAGDDPTAAAAGSVGGNGTYASAVIDLTGGGESSSPSIIEMESPALRRPKRNEETASHDVASGGRVRTENESPRDRTKGRRNAFERNNRYVERLYGNNPPALAASGPAALQPLGGNLGKVSEYKAVFTANSIPVAHCHEKEDVRALKSESDALYGEMNSKFHPDKLVGTSGKHTELFRQVVGKVTRAKTVAENEIGRRSHDAPDKLCGIRAACQNSACRDRLAAEPSTAVAVLRVDGSVAVRSVSAFELETKSPAMEISDALLLLPEEARSLLPEVDLAGLDEPPGAATVRTDVGA
eukprot:g12558.t1